MYISSEVEDSASQPQPRTQGISSFLDLRREDRAGDTCLKEIYEIWEPGWIG